MAYSLTDLFNLSLSHLKAGRIDNAESDPREEAKILRLHWPVIRDTCLRDFPWWFASEPLALEIIAGDPPDTEYAYKYPNSCLKVQGFWTNGVLLRDVVFRPGRFSGQKAIFTDHRDAVIEGTVRIEDPSLFTQDFYLAASFHLASTAAPEITGGDPFNLGERALKFYQYFINVAKANSINERYAGPAQEADSIRARW